MRVFMTILRLSGQRGKDSFIIQQDGKGLEYVTLTNQEQVKTRSGLIDNRANIDLEHLIFFNFRY